MSTVKKDTTISVESYLEEELARDIKHELIDGSIYAMAGSSANHERISGNIYAEFRHHLKTSPCEPFGSDMTVRAGSNFFYPDATVDCSFDEAHPFYTQTPVIIVEVLSKSTRRVDETTKRVAYLNIPSVQEYVLIEQDIVDVEVVRRNEGWQPKHYFLGDKVPFHSINLTLAVEEIYLRVHNEDVLAFFA